ncbi:MAG: tetratricopeptide repeat protein [Spirochaetales bacterium]|nr:tetratricopeptide repeat protein [Spirochaetales bacterium]
MNRQYELDKTLIDAYHFHRNDMFQEALECYMAAAELDRENNEIWFEMGSCLYSLGNYAKALECGLTSLKINSSHKKAWFNCGLSLSMLNEDERARTFYTEALKIDSEYGMAYFARANTYYFLEDYAEAIKDYTEALVHLPEYSREVEESHYYRALCYEKIDSFDFARVDYNWVLQQSPNRYDAIRKRALLSFKEKKYSAALKDIYKACELYPESRRLYQIQKKIEAQLNQAPREHEVFSIQ